MGLPLGSPTAACFCAAARPAKKMTIALVNMLSGLVVFELCDYGKGDWVLKSSWSESVQVKE